MKKSRVFLVLIVLILCIASLTACSRAKQYFVYGTTLEIQTAGVKSKQTVDDIYGYISSLESVLSPTVEGSDIYRNNHSKTGVAVACSETTMQIMRIATEVFKVSGGAYDPSVYPLVRLWKFSGDLYSQNIDSTPTDDEIDKTMNVVGLDKAFAIDFDNDIIQAVANAHMVDEIFKAYEKLYYESQD